MSETRLFIGNIPPSATEQDLQKEFSYYGKVQSVELKKKNDENVYGFVNIEIEEKLLTKCIREFGQQKFMGNFLSVSKAKESFLDRLKKEREQKNVVGSKLLEMSMKSNQDLEKEKQADFELPKIDKHVSSDDSSSEEEEEEPAKIIQKPVVTKNLSKFSPNEPQTLDKAALDDLKRQKSLQKLKDTHKEQKNAIRNALLSIDSSTPRPNKIIFEQPEPVADKSANQKKTKTLFEDDDEQDQEESPASFNLKKQFEGKKGEKLLELQTRYQGDKRFQIDEKFAEDVDEFIDMKKTYTREELRERKRMRKEMQNWDQDDLKEERDNQLSILQSITGESTGLIQPKYTQKGMLRFDPSKKAHQKYLDVVKGSENRNIDDDDENDGKSSDMNADDVKEVGEERFYNVAENLTEAFKQNSAQPFSIFSMLGIHHDDDKHDDGDEEEEEEKKVIEKESKIPSKIKAFQMSQIQFKYDSSETDEEAEKTKAERKKKGATDKKSKSGKYSKSGVFRHNFFFSESDERLKEAYAFIKKHEFIAPEILAEKRNHLKKVVKNKVRKAKNDKERHELKKRKKSKQ